MVGREGDMGFWIRMYMFEESGFQASRYTALTGHYFRLIILVQESTPER